MTTKKELQAIVDMQKEELEKISAKVDKLAGSKKTVAKNTGKLVLTTAWQTLAQTTTYKPSSLSSKFFSSHPKKDHAKMKALPTPARNQAPARMPT